MTVQPPGYADSDDDWRLLRIYVYYRVVLALLLVGLFMFMPGPPLLGAAHPGLYGYASSLYLLIAALSLVLTGKLRSDPRTQGFVITLTDVIAVTVIMHANGGPTLQLSMLFLVIVAAGNILLPGKQGPVIAVVATVAFLCEQYYPYYTNGLPLDIQTFAQSTLLGLSFIAVALFSQVTSRRFRQVEALARQRFQEIANLQKLNAQIIERMHTGIIVVNSERRLIQLNHASRQLLGIGSVFSGLNLKEMSATLDAGLIAWRQNSMLRPLTFKNQPGFPEISVSYMSLGNDAQGAYTLIFLENTALMSQKAQQMKLASLGRLTASIAHEVRNPLGAISHAAQLLAESPTIEGPDRRLLVIVQQHCVRVNSIIESVLQLSRRDKSLAQMIDLNEWLDIFIEDMLHIHRDIIIHKTCATGLQIRFDPQQLYQVVTNLVDNGIRHGLSNGCHELHLFAGEDGISQLPFLDVKDGGTGVPREQQKHLFEPFYTTEKSGTGLGLYVSSELCEANQAHLDYIPQVSGGCFRISFSHPNRLS